MHQRVKLCLAAMASATVMFATNAHAAADTWSTYATLNEIYPTVSSVIFDMDGPTISSSSSCASQNQFTLLKSHANYYASYSALLTALANNMKIRFYYDDASDDCRPTVTYIKITNVP